MNDLVNTKIESDNDLESTIKDLFNMVTEFYKTIIFPPLFFSIIAIFYSLSIPNQYTSEALLFPSQDFEGGGSEILGGGIDIGALAGINLSSLSGERNLSLEGMEIIKSRKFILDFIKKENILVDIMASYGWDEETNKLKINKSIFDTSTQKWTRKVNGRIKLPSDQEIYKKFISFLVLNKDRQTGFIKLRIKFFSPSLARDWAKKIVENLNRKMKEEDVIEANRKILFLDNELAKTSFSEMRIVLSNLKKQQIRKIMIAESRKEYVFRVIDPPIAPELKSEPLRSIIVLSIGFLSGIFFFLLAFMMRKLNYEESLTKEFPYFYKKLTKY
tara:strand:+ start:2438 stop:3427 length:990 start_codon:yes stop_codon:yes gene_type:complete